VLVRIIFPLLIVKFLIKIGEASSLDSVTCNLSFTFGLQYNEYISLSEGRSERFYLSFVLSLYST